MLICSDLEGLFWKILENYYFTSLYSCPESNLISLQVGLEI